MFSNQHQNIPETFQQIMDNDNRLAVLMQKVVSGDQENPVTQGNWLEIRRRFELKKDLIRAAEEILKWNKNKGNTG